LQDSVEQISQADWHSICHVSIKEMPNMSRALKESLVAAEGAVETCLRRYGRSSKEYYFAVQAYQLLVHKALSNHAA
jgi:hypothetical protein